MGIDIPVTCSLDLHGNVSPTLVDLCSGISAFRTFPHVDMKDAGKRATKQLIEAIGSSSPNVGAHQSLSFFIPSYQQSTLSEPSASLYKELVRYERHIDNRAHLSFLMGFYASDTYWTGPSILAYSTDDDAAKAAISHVGNFLRERLANFSAPLYDVDEAAALAATHRGSKPLVLAEVQDNPGGGSTGDAMSLISKLIELEQEDVAVSTVWDPQTLNKLSKDDIGSIIRLSLGGPTRLWKPLEADFKVLSLGNRSFKAEGPMLGGAKINLGRTAVLQVGGIQIVVTQNRVQNLDQGFFTAAGIEPSEARILVIKSTAHYRAHYEPIIDGFINVATPGALPADPSCLTFKRLRQGIAMNPAEEFARSS